MEHYGTTTADHGDVLRQFNGQLDAVLHNYIEGTRGRCSYDYELVQDLAILIEANGDKISNLSHLLNPLCCVMLNKRHDPESLGQGLFPIRVFKFFAEGQDDVRFSRQSTNSAINSASWLVVTRQNKNGFKKVAGSLRKISKSWGFSLKLYVNPNRWENVSIVVAQDVHLGNKRVEIIEGNAYYNAWRERAGSLRFPLLSWLSTRR